MTDHTQHKPLLWGKHCRGPGCDDYNEQQPSCACECYACTKPGAEVRRLRAVLDAAEQLCLARDWDMHRGDGYDEYVERLVDAVEAAKFGEGGDGG